MKRSKHIITVVFVAFIAVLSLLLAVLPKSDYSQNEKRVLQGFPEVTFESVAEGEFSKDIETFTSDQFPFRDLFVGISSYYDLISGRNGASGVYKCDDGYLIAVPTELDPALCERNVTYLSEFAEKNGMEATVMVVPNAGYIMADTLPKNSESYKDDEIYSIVNGAKGDMGLIDLRPVFEDAAKDTQIYYKTDHHVTTAGSYVMYKEFCEHVGIEAVCEFDETIVLDDFYGTNYSKSGLWLEKPDTVEVYPSANGYEYSVTIDDISSKSEHDTLYFYEHDENMDKYPVFLNGNHALVKIENKSLDNGKKILLIKDSYSHCFATFLCENYEEVYMVDMRYYRQSVSQLVKDNDITELLVLYGADNISGSTDIAWLE